MIQILFWNCMRRTFAEVLRSSGIDVQAEYNSLQSLVYERYGLYTLMDSHFREVWFADTAISLDDFNERHNFDFSCMRSDALDPLTRRLSLPLCLEITYGAPRESTCHSRVATAMRPWQAWRGLTKEAQDSHRLPRSFGLSPSFTYGELLFEYLCIFSYKFSEKPHFLSRKES